MKNHLWNMLASLKNGQLAKTVYILQTRKKICELSLNLLWNEGYILGYKINKLDETKLQVFLKYNKGKPVIKKLKSISKPGYRVYFSCKQLWKINSNKTFLIISTNLGLKSLTECKKLKIGGEVLFLVN